MQVYKLFASAVAAEGRNEECVGVGFGEYFLDSICFDEMRRRGDEEWMCTDED